LFIDVLLLIETSRLKRISKEIIRDA